MTDKTYAQRGAEWFKGKKHGGAAQPRHIGHRDSAPEQPGAEQQEDDDILITDDDLLSGEEAGDIGGLGNEFDDLDELVQRDLAGLGGGPTRKSWMAHRVAESLRGLKDLRSRPADPWPKDRIPEKLWRMLGDQALGLTRYEGKQITLEEVVAEADEEERLIKQCPEEDQKIISGLFDAFRLLGVFQDNLEWQRQLWEQAYWRRGNAEAFGLRSWTGPSGREGSRH